MGGELWKCLFRTTSSLNKVGGPNVPLVSCIYCVGSKIPLACVKGYNGFQKHPLTPAWLDSFRNDIVMWLFQNVIRIKFSQEL